MEKQKQKELCSTKRHRQEEETDNEVLTPRAAVPQKKIGTSLKKESATASASKTNFKDFAQREKIEAKQHTKFIILDKEDGKCYDNWMCD